MPRKPWLCQGGAAGGAGGGGYTFYLSCSWEWLWVSETHASTVCESVLSSLHWNEANPPHSSFWPELCCAVQCPWFMLGRVYTKLGLPSPALFTLAMAAVSLFSFITYGLDAAVGPAMLALSLLPAATIILVTVWLRMRVRSQSGIPGSLRWDFCAVVPWMCGLPCQGYTAELAAMDRQLSPTSDTQPPPLPPFAPRNKWSTGLFECGLCTLTGALPRFCCAASFPFFIEIRLLYRLGKGGLLSAVGITALQVLLPGILCLIALATQSATLIAVSSVLYFSNALGLLFHAWLRSSVRERYSIAGTLSDDVLQAIFCWTCSLAQLERETCASISASSNGNPKEVPLASQQMQQQQQMPQQLPADAAPVSVV